MTPDSSKASTIWEKEVKMGSRDLNKVEWRGFFDRVSKALGSGNAAEVEVMSLNLGD